MVALLPFIWYVGCRQLGLTRVQGVFTGLSVFLLQSQLGNGFEVKEYLLEGNLHQLFSQFLYPLTGM